MKKILFIIAVFGMMTSGMAQKNSNFEKRAKRSSNAIADKMDLSKERKAFLYEAILERQERNLSQLKGEELTQDQKSVIYAETSKWMNEKLSEKFTREEIKRINSIIREQQAKKRKEY